MKKTVMICDRCKDQYDVGEPGYVAWPPANICVAQARVTVSVTRTDAGARLRKSVDLCPKCATEIFYQIFASEGGDET